MSDTNGRIIDGIAPLVTPEGVTFVAWTDDHAVGFRCEHVDGRVEFIYLNPSSEDDEGKQATVFVYQGATGHPFEDDPCHFYNVLGPETT